MGEEKKVAKLTIVGGNRIEVIKGKSINFAQKHTVISNKQIIHKAKGGTKYKVPLIPPPFPRKLKCVVEFRPNKTWKGEFGFDWCRKADSKMQLDISYNGIIGEYGWIYATESGATFTPDANKYMKHLKEYQSFNAYNGKYYIPNVTLMDGETAILDAITNVIETPEKLYYKYDTSVFQLTILKKLNKAKGVNFDEKALQIKCLKKFSQNQSIKIMASTDKHAEKVG